MKITELYQKLQDRHTIESIMKVMDCNRQQAIYYVHRLRKKGYVKTHRKGKGIRYYNITVDNKMPAYSYYDTLNKAGPIKIVGLKRHLIHGSEPTPEETLVFAIKKGEVRFMLASVALFRKITDWPTLYALAKKEKIERKVGVLYDLARKHVRKIRKMPKNFRRNILPKPSDPYDYLIPPFKTRGYQKIAETWKLQIPFKKIDFEDYK